jgi:murein DD-endopeptidase MepM/ murein hydrolase activator NlpD
VGVLSTALLVASCWLAPVDAPVIDPFRAPACVWCPGNRGLEYGTAPGTTVRAVASGVVTYTGVVAGVGYVVVRHADGLRATYGGVSTDRFIVGQRVVARMVIGTTVATLHFGLRRGGDYLDPAPRIARLVHRARLVPVDGSAPRPLAPPVPRCDGAGRG